MTGLLISKAQTADDLLRGPSSSKKIDFKVIKSTNTSSKKNILSRVPIDGEFIDPIDPVDPPPPPPTTEAGSMAGNLSVSLTGAATYSIPFSLPPGIKDVTPSVGLSFSSQAANGLAGWGWNIYGLSTITRAPSTKFHDEQIHEVSFENNDRYMLDGQRLILKSGTYGVANSEYQTENYSNVKIIAYGTSSYGAAYGPSYFIVYYPNGNRAWYGNSVDSRGRIEWAIYKWQDPQGNYIQYDYLQSNELLRINTIKYGANGSNSSPNEIKFIYKTRTRPELSYIGGYTFKRANILDRIEVYGQGQLFRKYVLDNSTSTSLGYQLVTSITEFNGLSKSLSPIIFTYETPTPNGLNKIPNSYSIYPGINYNTDLMISGEFNGDGKMDFITYNKNTKNKLNIFTNIFDNSSFNLGYEVNTGSFDEVFASNILSWNGKMLSQQGITTASETIESSTGKVKFSTFAMAAYGPVFQYEKTWNSSTYAYDSDCNNSTRKKIPKEYISGDFNGDGLTDVIAITKSYTSRSCYKEDPNCDSGGGGPLPLEPKLSSNKINNKKDSLEYKNNLDINQRIEPIDPIDCPCICSTYTTSNSLAYFIDLDLTKTTNFVNSLGYLQAGLKSTDKVLAADFNGDGKTDLFHFTEGKLYVYELNDSNSLQLLYTNSSTDSFIKMNIPILLADYNGDGKTDFSIPTANNSNIWRFYLSKGTDYYVYSKSTDVTYQENYVYSGSRTVNGVSMDNPLYEFHYIAQDFNGDGKSDIIKHEIISPYSSYTTVSETIRLYSNKFNSTETTPSFQQTTLYQQNNNGLTKYGIPIFLDAKSSKNNLEYAYIDGNYVYAYEFLKDNKKDVSLKSITNNGVVSNISYQKLDNDPDNYPQIYIPDYDENYPYININIAPSIQLVGMVSETGEGITRTQEFQYKGAVTNISGLGFLGFKTTKRTNWFGTGVQKLWNISVQNPQKRGATIQQWVSESSSDSPYSYTSKTTNSYNTQLLSNKVFVNFPTQVVTEDALQGFSSTQSYIYDTFYNPTNITTTSPGSSKQLTFIYDNNVTGIDVYYYVGRPSKKTEASTLIGETFSTEEQYTISKNLLTKTLKKGNGTPWITEDVLFDVFGNVTQKSISASGVSTRTEHFENDTSGRFLIKSTDIEGLQTTFTYDTSKGNVLSTTNPYGLTTSYEYDSWNRLTKETDYLSNSTIFYYTPINGGGYSKLTNYAQGQDQEVTYNAFGWVTKSKALSLNDKWIQKSIGYDVIGRKIKESEPYFSTSSPTWWNTSSYDNYGRLVSQQSYTGKVTTFSYNGLSVTVDDGTKTATTVKDVVGNIKQVQDSGGVINYTYFANGSMKSANYSDHIVTNIIDGWGRKISLNDPSAGTYTYSYNILGEILQETTPKGITTYVYDSYGKVTSKNITGDNTNLSLTYSYNNASKLLESINGADVINQKSYIYTYQYDNYKRPINVIEDNDFAYFEKQAAYDSYGNVYKETYISNNKSNNVNSTVKVRNIYNNAGILYEIQNFDTSEKLWKFINENERGNPLAMELGNGLTKTRQYDQYGFLTQINDYNPSTSAYVLKMDYSFNAQNGTLYSRKNHSFNWLENFSYDNLDRLTSISGAVNFTQNYDTRGRITDNTAIGQYNYSSSNRYRLNEISLNSNGDSYYQTHSLQQIKYNAFKKPVDIFEEGKGRVSFEYSPMGNRSHAYYGGVNVEKSQRNFFKHYSTITPVEIIEDKVNNTTKIITYIGGDAYSAPIVHIKNTKAGSSNGYHYLHRDYLGSILAITDAVGVIKEQRQFGAWGVVDKFVDSGGNSIFDDSSLISRGYTGHEHFFEVGLIHMNGRMYDAKLGRFLSPDNYMQDPFNTQSFNRYGYVLNNPLIYNDISGEWFGLDDLIAGIIGGVVNLAINAVQGNINSWGDGFAAFGAGAGAGVLSLYGPAGWAAGGALVGGTNAYLAGQDPLMGAFTGAISGLAGGAAGQWAAKGLGNLVINGLNIASPVIKGIVGGALGGAAGGYVGGFAGGYIMTGDFSLAHQSGVSGLKAGAIMGGIAGGAAAYATSKANGINPWSGKADKSIILGRDMKGRVNPLGEDLGAETISRDWDKNFGDSNPNPTLKEGLDFNYEWLDSKTNNNYKVFDIGPGKLNNYSPNFTMEQNLIYIKNYPTINAQSFQMLNGKIRVIYFKY